MSSLLSTRKVVDASRDSRGFIVVAVLWILAALAALVVIYLTYVTNTAIVVAGNTDHVQTDALLTAGVELAAYQLTSQGETRPSSGTFNARVGQARVAVTFRSEAARVDLNAASRALLSGLMIGLGAGEADAAGYVDRIVAWRSPGSGGDDDPENALYRALGSSYLPRHAPFPHVDELWLVRGIPPGLVERMLPFVTVFSNLPTVNLQDAAPQALAALPGMTPDVLQQVLRSRNDPNLGPRGLLGFPGASSATLEAAKAYRLNVTVELASHRRGAAEVVILLLDGTDEPYRVLSWRPDLDGSAGKPL